MKFTKTFSILFIICFAVIMVELLFSEIFFFEGIASIIKIIIWYIILTINITNCIIIFKNKNDKISKIFVILIVVSLFFFLTTAIVSFIQNERIYNHNNALHIFNLVFAIYCSIVFVFYAIFFVIVFIKQRKITH